MDIEPAFPSCAVNHRRKDGRLRIGGALCAPTLPGGVRMPAEGV